jgi:hypothetical protein
MTTPFQDMHAQSEQQSLAERTCYICGKSLPPLSPAVPTFAWYEVEDYEGDSLIPKQYRIHLACHPEDPALTAAVREEPSNDCWT